MALPRSLGAFRHRPFALLWSGAFVSNIGRWMEAVAVGVLVTEATDQASWTGLVAVAAFAPNAVLSPLGGALADRFHRKQLLLTVMSVQLVLAGLLTGLAAANAAAPGVVTLVVLAAGCAGALGFPAFQAILPDLVPSADLPGAIALASAQWNLGRVVGPAFAGIAIGLGGYEWAFGINTLSYLAVIPVIAVLPIQPQEQVSEGGLVTSIVDGFRFAWSEPGIRAALLYASLALFFAAPFIGLIPAVAIKVFDSGTAGTAALVTAQGLGAVVAGVAFGSIVARLGARRTMLGALTLLPAALVLYALAPSILLAAVAVLAVGAVYLGALSSFTTTAQVRSPQHYRGRVMSAIMMLLGALFPLGSLVQGAIGDQVGLRVTTAGGAVALAIGVFVLQRLRPELAHALDRPAAAEVAEGTDRRVDRGPSTPVPSPRPSTGRCR